MTDAGRGADADDDERCGIADEAPDHAHGGAPCNPWNVLWRWTSRIPQAPYQASRTIVIFARTFGESDTESTHSSSGDSASSDEIVDRREPYYQICKIDKRQKRLDMESNMHIRRKKADTREDTFRIPASLLHDKYGRPKSIDQFKKPAVSPPRNPRVTLGLNQSQSRREIRRAQRDHGTESPQGQGGA